jgi:hypothetical protein
MSVAVALGSRVQQTANWAAKLMFQIKEIDFMHSVFLKHREK